VQTPLLMGKKVNYIFYVLNEFDNEEEMARFKQKLYVVKAPWFMM
jgi:hypothetical protein